MASSGMLRRVAILKTDVSEELSASFIRVTRIGELGTTLAVTRNRCSQRASPPLKPHILRMALMFEAQSIPAFRLYSLCLFSV
jgi:hypothetical protein